MNESRTLDTTTAPKIQRRKMLRDGALAFVTGVAAAVLAIGTLPEAEADAGPAAQVARRAGGDADAELIAVAIDYAAANAEIRRLEAEGAEHPDAIYVPLDDRRHAARERAAELVATTPAGLRAKASIFVGETGLLYGPGYRDLGTLQLLALSLGEDVLSLTGAAAAVLAPQADRDDEGRATVVPPSARDVAAMGRAAG